MVNNSGPETFLLSYSTILFDGKTGTIAIMGVVSGSKVASYPNWTWGALAGSGLG